MVFASNALLVERRNGISDRTLRRHFAALVDCGLICRNDSANGKRYARRNSDTGTMLRFGFDLAPLFAYLPRIAELAAQADIRAERLGYLRSKLRAVVQRLLTANPDDTAALAIRAKLRRKLNPEVLEQHIADLSRSTPSCHETVADDGIMSASDGQNVRHHHKVSKEHIENKPDAETMTRGRIASLAKEACPDTAAFTTSEIATPDGIRDHALTLAPMLGIGRGLWDSAVQKVGTLRTSLAIWFIVQNHNRIANAPAYFRAVTLGPRSAGFDPVALFQRMVRHSAVQDHAPVVRGQC